jgi:hypothetical protein
MSTPPTLIDRKEIASILGETVRVIERNEKSLGLDKCRRDISRKSVRYLRSKAFTILISRGFLPQDWREPSQ